MPYVFYGFLFPCQFKGVLYCCGDANFVLREHHIIVRPSFDFDRLELTEKYPRQNARKWMFLFEKFVSLQDTFEVAGRTHSFYGNCIENLNLSNFTAQKGSEHG